jgi:hypothetical protein
MNGGHYLLIAVAVVVGIVIGTKWPQLGQQFGL